MVSSGLSIGPPHWATSASACSRNSRAVGEVGVEDAVRPQRRVVQVPLLEQLRDDLEEAAVLHAEGDLVEVQRADVLAVEEREHLLVRAVLRDVVPRRRVELASASSTTLNVAGGGGRDELLVLGHVDREVRELARPSGSRRSSRCVCVRYGSRSSGTLRVVLAVGDRDRADRQLQQHASASAATRSGWSPRPGSRRRCGRRTRR